MAVHQQRIALVVQRYGAGVLGGAETHARLLAQRLQRDLGWSVTIYTTTAGSYQTWAAAFPGGESICDGIRVKRYAAWRRRRWLFAVYKRIMRVVLPPLRRWRACGQLAAALEWLWVILQGPFSRGLVAALAAEAGQYERIIFMTYLYYPTLAGARRVPDKAVLIPLAHDEEPFHFSIVQDMLNAVPWILANTEPEAELLRAKLHGGAAKIAVAGIGFETELESGPASEPAAPPYLLYLGRISRGKGVDDLLAWFAAYLATASEPGLTLKLAGHWESDLPRPRHAAVEYLGYIPEAMKAELMRGALAVVNPSQHESLSMIVVEAMVQGVPAIVNDEGAVLGYYTRVTETVHGCRDAASFARCLSQVLAGRRLDPEYRAALLRTRAWATAQFSWHTVLAAVAAAVGEVPAGAGSHRDH